MYKKSNDREHGGMIFQKQDITEQTKGTKMKYAKQYLLPFSVCFFLLQFLVFLYFYRNHKTFIWNYDGQYQHYQALLYYSNYLKELFSGGGLKMVDLSIGLGADVLTTLNYYVIGDPLTLLSVFVKAEHMGFFYSFLIMLRLFLAGAAFSAFCYHRKKAPIPTLFGSLVYVFGSYALQGGMKHPFFLNPMIYLPLLCIGVDYLMEKKKGYFLSIMVAISALSNFYFLYMLTVILFIYALVRFFATYTKDQGKQFLGILGKGVLYYLLGIGLSFVLLLPTMYAFSQNARVSMEGVTQNLIHYTRRYYYDLPTYLMNFGGGRANWTLIGVSSLAVFCIVITFFKKKENLHQKVLLLICAVAILIPFFGKVMNGFSTVSNRWCFAVVFLFAFLVADHYKEVFQLPSYLKWILAGFIAAYDLYALLWGGLYTRINVAIMTVLGLFILWNNYRPMKAKIQDIAVLAILGFHIAVSSNLLFQPAFDGFGTDFLAYGSMKNTKTDQAIALIKEMDEGFYRIDDQTVTNPNEAMVDQYNGVSFYFSLLDKRVYEYMSGVQNAALRFAFQYFSFNDRAYLNSLNSVKYIINQKKYSTQFGFEPAGSVEADGRSYYIYKNSYALPLAYTYDAYMTREQYDALEPLKKQQAMMQTVVLEEGTDFIKEKKPKTYVLDIPYKATWDGITYQDGIVKIAETESRLTLNYNTPKYSEVYLVLNGVDLGPDLSEKIGIMAKTNIWETAYTILRSRTSPYYFGYTDAVLNLGYVRRRSNKTEVAFSQGNRFHLQEISLYAQPLTKLKDYYEQRTKSTLKNVKISNNRIEGEIDTWKDRMLVFNVPYSKGWTAYVDGKKTEIAQANVMYMAIPITKGSHEILLKYRTPYIGIGAFISILSAAILTVIIIAERSITARRNA